LRFVVVAALVAGGYLVLKPTTAPVPPAARGHAAPPPGTGMFPPGARITEQKVVELNTATQAEIETLPGITPDYARTIIAGRPYRSMSDLARTGIPRAILDAISPPAVIRSTARGLPPPTTGRPK
jgi:competence protein ComEA